MSEEIWKDIKGCEGKYQVSNKGRVKSLSRRVLRRNGWGVLKEKILKQQEAVLGGYLSAAGNYVHRHVLEAFVGPCPEGMETRHLDGNPKNNNLENLCWGTHRDNIQDTIDQGKKGHGGSPVTDNQAAEIRELFHKGMTRKEISEKYGIKRWTVGRILREDTFQNLVCDRG